MHWQLAGQPHAKTSQDGHRRFTKRGPSSESIVSLMMFLCIVTSLRVLVLFNPSEGLFDGRGQRVIIGVEDEDSEQLCRLGLARVAADRMDIARPFGPALACPIDARLAVIHLRLDRARNHIGVDESRLRVDVGHGGRAGRVIDFHGDQRLARDIGNGRLEVLRDGLRFAIMGVNGAGHREGEGGAGGSDDGSDLHGLSPSVYRLVFVLHCFLPPCRPADYGHRTGQSRGMKSTWGPGSIMNTASVARTHTTAATAIAMWNPENSS